ncbi:MAG TPA: heparan-alpha-glucosaminide N-acetyltransferase [Burkholderiaceae bacterium]|nr:heparan-alpha-glucosaminide N-acetyltransferase [Burkholderiaceae bacterium]
MNSGQRLAIVDVLRGFAVAQMIVYHFVYDLKYFGWVKIMMTRDQPWVGWRTAIVTQFLLLVGVSLVLRTSFKPAFSDFARRWVQVAGAAFLVSAGSWFLFGPRYIWFGILHFVAAALLLARPLVSLGGWNLPLGLAVLAAGLLYKDEAFNGTPANILGFATAKPRTEDYVPLFPWFGLVLIGVALGAWWQRLGYPLAQPLRRLNDAPPRVLQFLGLWSLTAYLIHQPVLLSMLWVVKTLVG